MVVVMGGTCMGWRTGADRRGATSGHNAILMTQCVISKRCVIVGVLSSPLSECSSWWWRIAPAAEPSGAVYLVRNTMWALITEDFAGNELAVDRCCWPPLRTL